MNDLEILKEKAKLSSSSTYQYIREYQLNKIVELATSGIDAVEIKGMLKQIAYTDNWAIEYEKVLKSRRIEQG